MEGRAEEVGSLRRIVQTEGALCQEVRGIERTNGLSQFR